MSEHQTVELHPQPYDQGSERLPPSSRRRLVLALEISLLVVAATLTAAFVFLVGLAAWILTKAST